MKISFLKQVHQIRLSSIKAMNILFITQFIISFTDILINYSFNRLVVAILVIIIYLLGLLFILVTVKLENIADEITLDDIDSESIKIGEIELFSDNVIQETAIYRFENNYGALVHKLESNRFSVMEVLFTNEFNDYLCIGDSNKTFGKSIEKCVLNSVLFKIKEYPLANEKV